MLLVPFFLLNKLSKSQYSSFTATSQIISFIPGHLGIIIRRVWYKYTLKSCGRNLTVDWLGVIRTKDSEIGNRVTIGVRNWINLVKMGDDIIIGDNVSIISGNKQHSFNTRKIPIRSQKGNMKKINISGDNWIGSQCVIMNDISIGTIIGAGSIVTKTFDDYSILAGNPARIIKYRKT